MLLRVFIFLSFSSLLLACQPTKKQVEIQSSGEAALRSLSQDEKNADFDQLLQVFKTHYGPYQYKEEKLGINIEQIHNQFKAQALSAQNDQEFAAAVMGFGAALKDGHIQITLEYLQGNIHAYNIPLLAIPMEGKVLIGDISEDLAAKSRFSIGDEILEVDGKPPMEYLKILNQYKSLATEISNLHNISYIFYRLAYMTELKPTQATAKVKVKKASGETLQSEFPWKIETYVDEAKNEIKSRGLDFSVAFANDLNSVIENHSKQVGSDKPFFLNEKTKMQYGFTKVYPSDKMREKFALEADEKPEIYAAIYRFQGKKILLMRNSSYDASGSSSAVYLKAYQALMAQYENSVDVLVLDQTHNPGGWYCSAFYNLFAREKDIQAVQQCRADRKWVLYFKTGWDVVYDGFGVGLDKLRVLGKVVEKAYDEGKFLSEPVPLLTGSVYAEKTAYTWKKPMMVLIDELAGSCGDVFPMLVKANHRGLLFGQTTMGLGGNVEEIAVLNNSRIHVRLTRGLVHAFRPDGQYRLEDYIENNGVEPDIAYQHTVQDFRNGYINYVKRFSEEAIKLVP